MLWWTFLAVIGWLIAFMGLGLWILEREKRKNLYKQLSDGLEQCNTLDLELQQLQKENLSLRENHARLQALYESHQQLQLDKNNWLEQARNQLSACFNSLSQQSLSQAQQHFINLAESRFQLLQNKQEQTLEDKRKEFENLLEPIRQGLQNLEVERKNEQQQWHQAYGSLHELLKQQNQTTQLLQQEARGLALSLRASHVRGVWGELQLKRIVELAGMTDYCDFELQTTLDSQHFEGDRKRPDLLVNLPGGKKLAVDAKAPLKAYLEAMEDISSDEQKIKMQEHSQQLKQHVYSLSQKKYWSELEGLDFVVMFVPGDVFLHQALSHMPDLLEWAAQRHVLIATPTSLIALLKSCAYSWHHAKLEGKLSQIVDCGKELYTRLNRFCGHMEELRKGLDKSVRSFNELVGSWQSRVLTSAKRLHELDLQQEPIPQLHPLEKEIRAVPKEDTLQ